MTPEEALPWLALEAIPGLGPETTRRLIEAFPDPGAVFTASRASLEAIVGDKLAAALIRPLVPEAHQSGLDWISQPGNHLIPLPDADYPPALKELPDAPPLLYVKGDPGLLSRPMLAIVGSRNATPQGQRDAQAFAGALAEAGLAIVSGLAEGIDAAAHIGGLEGGASLAVLGTGLDRVYPAKHRDLAHRLAERGALVTEFSLGTPPRAGNFPRRNRIISGLAMGVLVVEAALDSGSLITARLAAEQGREVFALPGSIHSPLSKGCHRLIKDGAKLVESAADILDELRFQWAAPPQQGTGDIPNELLELMGNTPVALDQLAIHTGLTVDSLSAMLLSLELEGRVAVLPGGLYQRIY